MSNAIFFQVSLTEGIGRTTTAQGEEDLPQSVQHKTHSQPHSHHPQQEASTLGLPHAGTGCSVPPRGHSNSFHIG